MSNVEPSARFKKAIEQRHSYAREWKARTGGKVLGYFCCYLPEELVYAAGALPVRIVSSHQPQELSNTHIPGFFCSFCRDCLAEGLTGSYDYLDGIAMAHTCRQIVQAYESWCRHIPHSYHYYLPFPALTENSHLQPWVVAEMEEFQASLEAFTGRRVSPEALGRAIDIYNASRRLLTRLYSMRQAQPPPISGGLALEAALSSMLCDKAEHNAWLEALLKAVAKFPGNFATGTPHPGVGRRAPLQNGVLQRHVENLPPAPADYRPRLLVVGGENHDPELLHLIEAQGAWVVADDLCMGSRYFWGLVPEPRSGTSGLEALASRYLEKPSCPVKDVSLYSYHRRQEHILNLAREYRVDGAILVYQKFCDPQELDIPFLKGAFQSYGLPTCILELETTLSRGQIQTRVQAFLETLQLEIA